METIRKQNAAWALSPSGAVAFGYGRLEDFSPGSMLPPPPVQAQCGALEVDRSEGRATLAGEALHLTDREFALLLCLVDRANRVVRRADLVAKIWHQPGEGSNVVDVYIRRLRQKLGAHATMIVTIRGVGYRLRPEAA
jgi:DNA-binding response OmpR family regulator